MQGNQRGSDRASLADEGYRASLSPALIREGLRDMAGPSSKRAQVARQYDDALVKYIDDPRRKAGITLQDVRDVHDIDEKMQALPTTIAVLAGRIHAAASHRVAWKVPPLYHFSRARLSHTSFQFIPSQITLLYHTHTPLTSQHPPTLSYPPHPSNALPLST